jgi:hypothetical protein
MSEVDFWRGIIRPKLSMFGVLHRIENVVELGTPDVTYTLRANTTSPAVSGWIELKHANAWPARPDTKFRFSRYTPDQAGWLYEWDRVGGKACVMALVGTTFFLVPGYYAHDLQRGATRDTIKQLAAVWDDAQFPTGRMVKWLTTKT